MNELDSEREAWREAPYAVATECGERLQASDEELARSQTERLQALLATARERSAWHRDRLAGIDIDAVVSTDLGAIPTMTKSDLMANWDDVVTDGDLTLDIAQRHLRELERTEQFAFCLNRFVVVASGGSSGHRGVFAYDRTAFAGMVAPNVAHVAARQALLGIVPPSEPPVQARVLARAPTHLSSAMGAILAGGLFSVAEVPAVLPIAEMVARLNRVQPELVFIYPSVLHRLAVEALEGRLQIEPAGIACGGEPLLPETAALVVEAFGLVPRNAYMASEGYIGETILPDSALLHLADTVIVELVDADNRPVPAGTRSAKMLLTNLHNHLQPLIRYEITDEITEHDGPGPLAWSGRWIEPPLGRMDDGFFYGSTQIHPHLFRSRLVEDDAIVEYQVLQTRRGATVRLVTSTTPQPERLARRLEADLAAHGIDEPHITIEVVDSIERHASTGKFKRFVPLASA